MVRSLRLVQESKILLELAREAVTRGEAVKIQAEMKMGRIAGKGCLGSIQLEVVGWILMAKLINQKEAAVRGQTYLQHTPVSLSSGSRHYGG